MHTADLHAFQQHTPLRALMINQSPPPLTTTANEPAASIEMPVGLLNVAVVPIPSAAPEVNAVPARVVTMPDVRLTRRMSML